MMSSSSGSSSLWICFMPPSPIDPDSRLYLPGELEFITEQENLKIGIPIDTRTVEKLRQLAEGRGVPCPL